MAEPGMTLAIAQDMTALRLPKLPTYLSVLICWLLLGQLSFGSTHDACEASLAPGNALPIPINITITRFEPKEHEALREYAEKLNRMLGPLGLTTVEVRKLGGVAGEAKSRELIIWVPSIYHDPKLPGLKSVASTNVQRPIFDHEFGHLVFDHNLILEISNEKASFLEHLRRVGPPGSGHPDHMILKRFWELRGPYNELFADLVAVLERNDGASVADALGYGSVAPYTSEFLPQDPGRTANVNGPRPRDFTEVTSFKHWKLDHSPMYSLLDPVRGALWRRYVKQQLTPQEKQHLLKSFLRATARHLERRVAKLEKDDSPEAPAKINQDFFRLLTDELRK